MTFWCQILQVLSVVSKTLHQHNGEVRRLVVDASTRLLKSLLLNKARKRRSLFAEHPSKAEIRLEEAPQKLKNGLNLRPGRRAAVSLGP
jgi:hypothetical protein